MVTIRVPEATHRLIQELAGGGTMQSVVVEAVENLRRQRMFDEANLAFSTLRNDPEAWAREQAERDEWDGTLADGLEDD
ncbi:MAG: toxin-antitoxin system protein [Isosphaeraceae bacterium]